MRKVPKTTGQTIDNIQQNHTHNIKNWDVLTSKIKHSLICKLHKTKDKQNHKTESHEELRKYEKQNHSTEHPAPWGYKLGRGITQSKLRSSSPLLVAVRRLPSAPSVRCTYFY